MNPDSLSTDCETQTFEEILHEIGELLKLAEIEIEINLKIVE